MAPTLAWLGLGNMGRAMSNNLATKGSLEKPIVLWSRTTANAEAHHSDVPHSVVVPSLAEAVAQSDIIWSCLSDQDAVFTTFEQILKQDVKGKLFIECSTVTPEASTELVAKVLAAGDEFVSMPVFGEPSMAKAGILTCVPAGKRESVDKVKPYLIGVIGRAVIDYGGEEPAKASLLKVIGNTFIINMIEGLAQGHVLAQKTGLGSANLEKFLEVVFPGPYMIHSKRMSSGAYYKEPPIVNIQMAQKVADHVLDLAKTSGTKLAPYEVAKRHMDMIEKHAGAAGDIDGLMGAIRLESGLPYELD
jgi:3-hydroxyisobutyrate dehydrogenase-like beta-hydroxyacid dehydrogenase